jgi:MFS family permease
MSGFARLLPYALAFTSSLCIMTVELVSSRLVAQHVGQSLTVWTSVIGIILGGICLGNVLGGRLADRVEPRRAIGPLFAIGCFLTVAALWINAGVGYIIPDQLSWGLRTVFVVVVDFLAPATVLGMVGPVVAKMAVEQAHKAGSAIGDVYFWGAVGSIAGTFLTGFVLMGLAPTSTIMLLVAAALALLAGLLFGERTGLVVAIVASAFLAIGSILPLVSSIGLGSVNLGSYQIGSLAVVGNLAALALAIMAAGRLLRARSSGELAAELSEQAGRGDSAGGLPAPSLNDLAVLAFVASLAFMALEMVAGRLVQRHLGSSIYGWTSVIGVLLAGLSLGNFLGGKIADFVKSEKQASWLFLAASVLTLTILLTETQPKWFSDLFLGGDGKSLLSQAIPLSELKLGPASVRMNWQARILFVVTLVFFLPALTMGTVSPVVAKLAVDRLKRFKRTGTAIGQVYAWGMVGSILGTFLTGFVLIDVLGTKGVILVLGTVMAFGATLLGSVWHAVWAGIPLGLCVLAFTPPALIDVVGKALPRVNGAAFEDIGRRWGIREEKGDPNAPNAEYAWIDESNYYYIKVNNEPESAGEIVRRTLVLDNLIHGYFVLGHPERLDYDYEHIYALVAYRAAKASGKVTFKPAPEPAEPKPAAAPKDAQPKEPVSKAPAKNEPKPEAAQPAQPKDDAKTDSAKAPAGLKSVQATGDGEQGKDKDKAPKSVPGKGDDSKDTKKERPLVLEEEREPSTPSVDQSSMKTLFLGGGAYCFQRYMQHAYPGTAVDVAEIDPSVTEANFMATGLPRDTTIKTHWGDARQFVEKHRATNKYDLVFGDAFNDFSVPWHLTTREFNEMIKQMLTPTGVYMINIIDVYESDAVAKEKAEREIAAMRNSTPREQQRLRDQKLAEAHRYGGFVGAWTKTAKLTFPHVVIFGTDDEPGSGKRETFVVVASMQPLDLEELGARLDDPKFYTHKNRTEPKPYGLEDTQAVDKRSRNIVLTDDYAPVEILLAPVAETRADD